ncbi:MAG TPA: co-chaperone GroES [Candidatus Nanoarchaeia archaeon]|nr:co-chaperone GroES [Candidatus Nanoarchaeia archaeon]
MNIIPLGERVLIKQLKREEKTKGGIYLPKGTDEKKEGEVVEVGTLKDLKLSKGDRIIYGGYSSEEIEIEGQKYLLIEAKDIIARIEI